LSSSSNINYNQCIKSTHHSKRITVSISINKDEVVAIADPSSVVNNSNNKALYHTSRFFFFGIAISQQS